MPKMKCFHLFRDKERHRYVLILELTCLKHIPLFFFLIFGDPRRLPVPSGYYKHRRLARKRVVGILLECFIVVHSLVLNYHFMYHHENNCLANYWRTFLTDKKFGIRSVVKRER